MAGSLLTRFRARLEELQKEMQPEAGFDRRAYGYDDDSPDATFEDVDREEESPWRRPATGAPEPEPDPGGTPEGPRTPRGRMRQAAEVVPPRAAPGSRPAAARPDAPEPSSARGGRPGGGVGRDFRSPPTGQSSGPVPGSPAVGVHVATHDPARTSARGVGRLQRLRRRIRQPDSLRELFLLREVIDRPVSLRRRSRGR